MEPAYKVLWREGLYLKPQHFQALDRRCEWLSRFHARMIWPFFWGIHSLDIDTETIVNRQFAIRSIQAVMRDGTPVDSPGVDQLPPARNFEDILTPDQPGFLVYLGIPREDLGRPGVRMDATGFQERMRYGRVVRALNDYVTGSRSQEIEFVEKKPEIRFEGEPSDAFDLMPIARIETQGVGRPLLSQDFLPPSLTLQTARAWVEMVAKLYGEVNALTTQLYKRQTYGDQGIKPSMNDLPQLFQVQELAAALPALIHCYYHPETHPFHFYRVVSELTARLGIATGVLAENYAADLPPYEHESPAKGLRHLLGKLEKAFEMISVRPPDVLPLDQVPDRRGRWCGNFRQVKLVGTEEFFLWAQADMPVDQFIQAIQRECRIASPERIEKLLTYALPGVPLDRVAHPPSELPGPQKGHYFRLNIRHEYWQEVMDAQEIVLDCSHQDIRNLQVRLHYFRP